MLFKINLENEIDKKFENPLICIVLFYCLDPDPSMKLITDNLLKSIVRDQVILVSKINLDYIFK